MLIRAITLASMFWCTAVQASDANDWEAAMAIYEPSYLDTDTCFGMDFSSLEYCVISRISDCVYSLEDELTKRGFGIPRGAALSPDEYCNALGAERADHYLNRVYSQVVEKGPVNPVYRKEQVEVLRDMQRKWIEFRDQFCWEENITGWHAGGSGWGAVLNQCQTRLSIQQAINLQRYFIYE